MSETASLFHPADVGWIDLGAPFVSPGSFDRAVDLDRSFGLDETVDVSVLRTHFEPLLGAKQLAAITPADVRGVVEAMANKLAPATVRTNLGVLRAVLNAAVEADLLGRSPVRAVRIRKGDARERPTLTSEELERLAVAIGIRHRALVLVAGVIGLRWSEAIGLRVGDINFLGSSISIRQTIAEVEGRLEVAEAKSRASRRTLAVPEFLLDELSAHLARCGALRARPRAGGPRCSGAVAGAVLLRPQREAPDRPGSIIVTTRSTLSATATRSSVDSVVGHDAQGTADSGTEPVENRRGDSLGP